MPAPRRLDQRDPVMVSEKSPQLPTPDALQAACAVENKATALITNDPVFETVTLDRFLNQR